MVEMVTTPEEYPLWRTPQPIIVQRNQPHKYIYSLFEGKRDERVCLVVGLLIVYIYTADLAVSTSPHRKRVDYVWKVLRDVVRYVDPREDASRRYQLEAKL